ncbi:MAG: hypothetical protein ACKVS8_06730 [Phycisphaerales bacterium]
MNRPRLLMLGLMTLQPSVLMALCPCPVPTTPPMHAAERHALSATSAATASPDCGETCSDSPLSCDDNEERPATDQACAPGDCPPWCSPAECCPEPLPAMPGEKIRPPADSLFDALDAGPAWPPPSRQSVPVRLGAARARAPSSTPLQAWTCVRTT